ncbi:helix-turn-helix transcriptional regulator [Flavobacterium cheonhonense]|jgi:transcriptional regulator with XRE-family HTH domain|uniref:Helix-turn-helix transcriptional regulator n=2 Tax=Flavobacterium cheonhonense TaxID=706185 RepID=A0ABP7TY26_9FLAO|nr:MAG: XRE family transcriptional regulator [Flavobacterium sp.] [Flavobacterium sp. FEMGT703F]
MTISEDTFLKNMGIRIRQLREKKEFSQEYLANICDIPKNQIGRIERAEINTTIKTIVKIANALEIEPKELFNFKS